MDEHIAADRERAVADRDLTASDREESLAQVSRRVSDREHAIADREYASADRELAAADRAGAARDREQARAELRQAQFDQLTGALGRGLGLVLLEREINRARHANGRLVLAYVDVDALKHVNDSHGHAAGDALLQVVVTAIQHHLRSYDPIVRMGGDEFVCALANATIGEACARFHEITATIKQTLPDASISVGFAALRPADTLEELTRRGDAALYEAKRAR